MASLPANGTTITAPGPNGQVRGEGAESADNQGFYGGIMSDSTGMEGRTNNEVDGDWPRPSKKDREAAINMLPNADPTTLHSCDACNKDITGVRVLNRFGGADKIPIQGDCPGDSANLSPVQRKGKRVPRLERACETASLDVP